ncbi:MAG: tRNA (adenosine(37)-N6)-threonylcarbamoyltransferase complex transferase subunit TsaD [Candidatus Wildermuthbacteria bacterium RIFCSPHIGHO2_01_FULL_48_25]|uniref:tRNA N6-adenosine threonylcarbamoyltransferase n=1 Tax=Candidatus Wildermuthbacteria bacterium RIFCSPLOWO2_01_FULL_48_16 TaxID=1802461 RepID=A0A1G2RLH6_9BACT|nr:MAG: tRNA (adenosine(37)-N6)-threonylcarbamoyltransferase complex transferase subunit TsaD [Candidatus Wildermuthbacteria bacterium RIFCSPHIGHO2_01_FULL_48_25]OHA69342.1 MAG: tRNA (adenosine(37)-N6)-threonylcarbamoyltransferase complex transferase subunit TsaD [Candidatus Wildermuthbacteria bacterium RIFCSPHIGHO2_02_FULL_49_12b]OHA73219.1 MAG: tRNA (adenosine(37)-N6)-threonylcarbamoyltransferase complex transferase subunit TsaD [Candidatus Wildermuthbacteria bacterium RIFCSPLOWO2_01_FULL_48_16
MKHMRILSIETSCDETAIAVVEAKLGRFEVLAHVVASQVKLHAKYGGVYPTLAKRTHQKNLPIVLAKTLKEAGSTKAAWKPLDAIALTVGPGLDPCLWAGIEFAKTLAQEWDVPIIPVNHIEGHLIISLLASNLARPSLLKLGRAKFPAVALIVSGGHTQLILVKGIGKYKILGETRDDAAGECFDKTARILGLPYPGGPAIAKLAALPKLRLGRGPKRSLGISLPRPMLHSKDYDFSFSGLKTAVLYDYQSRSPKIRKSKEYIQAMAREIQQAIIDVLVEKTMRAAEEFEVKSIVLGGGVAANKELRKRFKGALMAPSELCTDNGLMIALAGYFNRAKKTKRYGRIVSQPNLTI